MLDKQIAKLYGTVELHTQQFDAQLTRIEQRLKNFNAPLQIKVQIQDQGLQKLINDLRTVRHLAGQPVTMRAGGSMAGGGGGGGRSTNSIPPAPFMHPMGFGPPGRGGTFLQPSYAPHFMAGMPLQSNVVGISPHSAAAARSQQIFGQNVMAGMPPRPGFWGRARNYMFGVPGQGGSNSPLAMQFGRTRFGQFGIGAGMGAGLPFALNPTMMAGSLTAMGTLGAFRESAQTEAREATLRRVTGFSEEQTAQLSRGLSRLAIGQVGATRGQTFELAEIAGRAGTFRDPNDLIQLTRLLTEIQAVVPEMQPENLANQFVRLNNVFDNTIDQTELVANALVAVDTASTASAKELLDVASRLAPVTQLVGGTAGQTVAFAGALREAGIAGERGSTATMRVFKNMSTNTGMFAGALQMPEDQLREQLRQSPFLAFRSVAERINELTTKGPERLDFLASAMGLKNVRDLELVGKFATPRIQDKFQEFLGTVEQQERNPTALSQAQQLLGQPAVAALEELKDSALQLADTGFRPLLGVVGPAATGLAKVFQASEAATSGLFSLAGWLNRQSGGIFGSEGMGDLVGDIGRGVQHIREGKLDTSRSPLAGFGQGLARGLLPGAFLGRLTGNQPDDFNPQIIDPNAVPMLVPGVNARFGQTMMPPNIQAQVRAGAQQRMALQAAQKAASQERALARLQAARDRGDPNANALAAQLAAMGLNVPGGPGPNTRGMTVDPLDFPVDQAGKLEGGFFKGLTIAEAQQVQMNARGDIGAFGRQVQNQVLNPAMQFGQDVLGSLGGRLGRAVGRGPLGLLADGGKREKFEFLTPIKMSPLEIETARNIFRTGTVEEKNHLIKTLGLPPGAMDISVKTALGRGNNVFGMFEGTAFGDLIKDQEKFIGRSNITDTFGGMMQRQQDILDSNAKDLQEDANMSLEEIVKNTGKLVENFAQLALPALLR